MPLIGGVQSAVGVATVANCGASNGTISYPTVLPPNANGYIYNLLPNGIQQTQTTFTGLAAGSYKVEIFDSNSPTCR